MATYTSTISIHAPVQRVFDTLTKPELTKLWQFGRVLTTDWIPGSDIKFSSEWEGKTFEERGTVVAVHTNELVKYRLVTPHDCITSYVLTSDNGKTQLDLIQEDNRPKGFVGATLQPILESLKAIAEAD